MKNDTFKLVIAHAFSTFAWAGIILVIIVMLARWVGAHDLPISAGVYVHQWEPKRPNISLGYGPIIDDLESMTVPGHPMRSTSDPGNWVHELTHQVNSDQRGYMSREKRREYNSAYILHGLSACFPEPGVTLAQVAAHVPVKYRGGAYQLYLVQQQRYWNGQPLYVLDEAVAAGNALLYQVQVKKPDEHRVQLVVQWANYSQSLFDTVDRFDHDYSHLSPLRAFVEWHNQRLAHLFFHHHDMTK